MGTITRVEVSVDDGTTWHDAHLEEPRERWLWVRWSYLWDATEPGAVSHPRARHRRDRPRAAADPVELPAQALRRHRADGCDVVRVASIVTRHRHAHRSHAHRRLHQASPDPEAAFSMLRIDEQAKKVVPAPGLAARHEPVRRAGAGGGAAHPRSAGAGEDHGGQRSGRTARATCSSTRSRWARTKRCS